MPPHRRPQGPQYGYCYARTADEKKVYVSAVFEMPMEDIRAGSGVIKAEFDKALVQKYGSPTSPNEARSGGCPTVWNVSTAAAEQNRQINCRLAPTQHADHRHRLDVRAHGTDPAAWPTEGAVMRTPRPSVFSGA